MKKFFGFTIGGLKHKILTLVFFLLVLVSVFYTVITVYRSNALIETVSGARNQQQKAIRDVSTETMELIINNSMTKTTALQAYIADDMFNDIKTDVLTLQNLASSVFSNRNKLDPAPFFGPDASNDGIMTAQALAEEGVDINTSEYLSTISHIGDFMIAMCENSPYMSNCYVGFVDGTLYCVDDDSSSKFDDNGNVIPFPVRERPWYTDAVESGELNFTGVITDTYSGRSCVTCSAPIYANGELVGVIGIDLFLDSMQDYVEQSMNYGGFLCIVNENGHIVFAPEGNGVFEVQGEDEAFDLRRSGNNGLAMFINAALSSSTEIYEVTINDKDYYAAGSPIPTVGWTVVSFIDKASTNMTTEQMLLEYDRINQEASASFYSREESLKSITILLGLLILLIGIVSTLLLSNRIVKPIESMTQEIIEGGKTGKLFEMKEVYKTNDEIEVLAESFDELSKKTKEYIEDITQITKENERISTELTLATAIQASMLPHIFPPFPDRSEFDIYAVMDPAREVGGDFYDFFLIDENHLCLVIADVSGKGIPAALFMMISKTILQSCAMLGMSPKGILEKTNEALCSNNQVEMFVTCWIGILDIKSGVLKASNAGHEYPALKRDGGKFELYKDKHGLALGAMEDAVYNEYEIKLNKGDELFVYTDGVPEATNSDEKMFKIERMLDALNSNDTSSSQELLDKVKSSVGDFVKDAEQFDDLTMLGFKYYGSDDNKEEAQ